MEKSSCKSNNPSLWIAALGVTLGMQTISAFLIRMLPVIAPELTAAAGVAPHEVGMLAGVVSAGTMFFLVFGSLVITCWGPVRSLQAGSLVAGMGALAALTANWWLLLFAAFLLGVGYGPSPPAGSEILARSAPQRHRSLIMSVKQSGVPLGGVIAGLLMPAVTLLAGWRMAILTAVFIAVAAALVAQPWRKTLDTERDTTKSLSLRAVFSPANFMAPFRILRHVPGMSSLTFSAFCFSCVQGCLLAFFVTHLTVDLRLSLPEAGAAFAAMQVSGTAGRIIMGWLADRLGGQRTLFLLSFCSAAMVIVISRISPEWPFWLVTLAAFLVGITSVSWNGVFLAEVARIAPSGRVADATSGLTLFNFAAYALAPVAFTFLIPFVGSYSGGFAALAVIALLAAPPLWLLIREEKNG